MDFGIDTDILTTLVNIIIIGSMVVASIAFFGRTVMKRFTNSPEIKRVIEAQDKINMAQTMADKIDSTRFDTIQRTQESQTKTLDSVVERTQQIEDRVMESLKKEEILLQSQQDTLTGLGRRSDLVNGNIASIRTDLADLSDDIEELYSMVEDTNTEASKPVSKPAIRNQELRTYRRTRRRGMKEKRRRIESDRIDQSEQAQR